eukprot:XP_001610668.1 hypothetical protein [Babesia bovis T2Bo]
MSKHKKARQSVDVKGSTSTGNTNPFDSIRRQQPKISIKAAKPRRTKVIKKHVEDPFFASDISRRSQKLDLFDLNIPLELTHKDAPIDQHYDDTLSEDSDDGFRYTGEPGGYAKALEEYKRRRIAGKLEKSALQDLRSKLDSEFDELDMNYFIQPRQGLPTKPTEHDTTKLPKKVDKFSENLKRLMAAPVQSRGGVDLLRQFYEASSIKAKCDIAKKFVNNQHVPSDTADKCMLEIARPLSDLLSTPSGNREFASCIDTFTEFVHYLCQRSPKEYHAYFTHYLKGVYASFEQDSELSRETLLVLYFLIKVAKIGTALYKAGLIVLEKLMQACEPESDDHSRIRLLLVMAYASTLDSGLYIPFFFKLAMKCCVAWHKERLDTVETILDMTIASLKLLSNSGCHVYPVCLHIIRPNIAKIVCDSPKLVRLKELVEVYANVKLLPNVLDVYKKPKIELQIPNFDTPSSKRYDKDSTLKREKAEYKSLRREFMHRAASEAKQRSLALQQRKAKTHEKYRKVMRDAMVEQDMLRKEFTKPT